MNTLVNLFALVALWNCVICGKLDNLIRVPVPAGAAWMPVPVKDYSGVLEESKGESNS